MFELSPVFAFVAPRRPRRLPRRGVVVAAGVEVSPPAAGVAVVVSVVIVSVVVAAPALRRPRRPRRVPPALPPPPGVNEHLFISPGTGESVRRSPLFFARTETDC